MSLYDRDYMNSRPTGGGYAYGRGGAMEFFAQNAAVKILIIINIACFFAGAFVDRIFGYGSFFEYFALSLEALEKGRIWTLLTYSFLHANILHIFLNMLALYFLGSALEKFIGTARFLSAYFAGGIVGGVIWLLLSFSHPEALVGASASVMSVFACFCAFYPPIPLTFLIFFVLPISLRPMTMLKFAAAFELLGLLYSLSFGGATIAYSAHLGGMLAGMVLAKKWRGQTIRMPNIFSFGKTKPFKNAWAQRNKAGCSEQKTAADYKYSVNISAHADLKKEVDRILDKINVNGFSSLTESERETLRRAKEIFK